MIVGTCHCGRVRFEVTTAPTEAFRCNCSYCARRGWLHAYAEENDFRLLSGDESLSEYSFGAATTTNYRCANCGIHTHFFSTYGGKRRFAYSLACCDDFDGSSLPARNIDGKSF